MIYIDSNIFIFAILDTEDHGEACRSLLSKIKTRQIEAATSSLTYDEVVREVKKHKGLDNAVYAGEYFLKMSNLFLFNATRETMLEANKLVKAHGLDPRDAIHAASCLLNNIKTIISEDPHFDKLDFLKRKPLT